MEDQVRLLAQLSAIDARLDELHDELGDLPQEVKALENDVQGEARRGRFNEGAA